jgi:Lon protease-like protein
MGTQSDPVQTSSSLELPLFPLHTVLFPGGPLPLRIFEPRYVDMVRRCMHDASTFGVVHIRAGAEAGSAVTSTASIGTSARIADFYPLSDGMLGLLCLGERKFRLLQRWCREDGLNVGRVEWLSEERSIRLPSEHRRLGTLLERVLPRLGELYEAVERHAEDASWVSFRLAEILPLGLDEKQRWLEISDPLERLAQLAPLIRQDMG